MTNSIVLAAEETLKQQSPMAQVWERLSYMGFEPDTEKNNAERMKVFARAQARGITVHHESDVMLSSYAFKWKRTEPDYLKRAVVQCTGLRGELMPDDLISIFVDTTTNFNNISRRDETVRNFLNRPHPAPLRAAAKHMLEKIGQVILGH